MGDIDHSIVRKSKNNDEKPNIYIFLQHTSLVVIDKLCNFSYIFIISPTNMPTKTPTKLQPKLLPDT